MQEGSVAGTSHGHRHRGKTHTRPHHVPQPLSSEEDRLAEASKEDATLSHRPESAEARETREVGDSEREEEKQLTTLEESKVQKAAAEASQEEEEKKAKDRFDKTASSKPRHLESGNVDPARLSEEVTQVSRSPDFLSVLCNLEGCVRELVHLMMHVNGCASMTHCPSICIASGFSI